LSSHHGEHTKHRSVPAYAPSGRFPILVFVAHGYAELMNSDRISGQWKQVKGRIKEQWGRLTDDDLDVIAGKRDQLLGRIQQRHGVAKEEARRQVEEFEKRNPDVTLDDSSPSRDQA
jgi:uncharacterized protein YjbJ (UPF0337 family)